MTVVTDVLNHAAVLAPLWLIVVAVCGIYLWGLGALTLLQPQLADRFFKGHATSPSQNALEAVLRIIAGLGFMGASPRMASGEVFVVFGAILAASGLLILVLFDVHRRYAARAVPLAMRAAPLIGVASMAMGAGVLWAMS